MYILGISCYYHDSAAVILEDDNILAAAQEERFTRKKHDSSFPANALRFCLNAAGLTLNEVDRIVFYESPTLKFKRILKTYVDMFPRSIPLIGRSLPKWLGKRLYWKRLLMQEFEKAVGVKVPRSKITNTVHHHSHAASAFFPSPFSEAAVLVADGVGEFATTTIWRGRDHSLERLFQIDFPHSIGLLYSAFTYYTGFKVNSGEYKVMGLAPYGVSKYVDLIKKHLIDIHEDGSYRLNMDYFDYATGDRMTNEKFHDLFGGPPREPESTLTQREMDLARSIQDVCEEVMLKLALKAKALTGSRNLCLAGGVALNCVANGKILNTKEFDGIWIQPAAGDAGGALGAALTGYYEMMNRPRTPEAGDRMRGAFLGPAFAREETRKELDAFGAKYEYVENDEELLERTANLLVDEKVVGWHSGRMEFGPRALGARSIIGDARSESMQKVMNLKIKYRESFRPFAPSVLRERLCDYFDINVDTPYMLLVAAVRPELRRSMTADEEKLFGIDKLNLKRSTIPAVTHVDYSARIQSVHKNTNPRYHRLLELFEKKTGCPVVVNTSFNVRGEPIVCTPADSYRCFMRTEMDALVIDNFLLLKNEQPKFDDKTDWKREFELD